MRSTPYPDRSRAVALWLFAVAVLVFAMVVVGGATRLTGSGLSITEWKPITGVLPPLSHQAWLDEFARYQHIPQFRLVNPDMTLAGFQGIYWWEWTHRLLGRLVGVAFFAPFLFFLFTRGMARRLIWRCWALLALGGLQGLVGWWMVASGLSKSVAVAPERLMLHLGLALILFCALIWTGLEAWFGTGRPGHARRWRGPAAALAGAVFVQMLLGALVAGNHAGQVFNDWPLMNGRLFPADYLEGSWFGRALLHSQAAVQFNHRLLAYVLVVAVAAIAWLAWRSRDLVRSGRGSATALAVLVLVQAALGVATLLTGAPLGLALAHQCLAAAVLAVALAFAWRVRRA